MIRLNMDSAVTNTQDIAKNILWQNINTFIMKKFKGSPKITYSKYSAKPGWNVRYQKSGHMICTLHPEKEGFSALIVIPLSIVPIIEAMSAELEPEILDIIKSAIPLDETLWVMIEVDSASVLESVKKVLQLICA